MKARWIGSNIETYEDLLEPGDIGIGAENYHYHLMVNCPICHQLHIADLTKNNGRWDWDETTLTLSPSYKCYSYYGVCHWNLISGEFIIHGDSTAKPTKEKENENV